MQVGFRTFGAFWLFGVFRVLRLFRVSGRAFRV